MWFDIVAICIKNINKEEIKIKNKFLLKIIAVLCTSATLTATPTAVIATKDKLLGKKTKLQNKEDANFSEKKTIKNLIDYLKKACGLGNTIDALQQVEKTILKLSKIKNFYGMEPEVARAINFAIQKNCFNEMWDDSHYKATKNVLKYVCLTSNETANILDRCANNENAQKFVAISIKNWINHAYVDFNIFNKKIADKLELKLRKILAKCSKNHDAKKFIAQAIANLASISVAPCTCSKCNQSPSKQGAASFDFFGKTEDDYFEDIEISFDEVKCEIECKGETNLQNILTECFDSKEARKYVVVAIKKLIEQEYFDFFQNNFEIKLKIISEICDMFEKCAEDEDNKPVVAWAVNELVNSHYVNDLTDGNINKIINLLSKCSNNVATLRDISSSVHALAHTFGRIYENDPYDERIKTDDESDSSDLLDIYNNDPVDNFLCDDDPADMTNVDDKIEINNFANALNILYNPDIFDHVSNNSDNIIKNDAQQDGCENVKFDLNKDVTNDNLSNVFDLLCTCINNSNLTGHYCANSIQQLLLIKNFQDMVKNNSEIKNKIVKSLAKCWSLETYAEPTHDIIENIINRYRKKFFSDSDIKEIKNDKKIKWDIESEKPSFDIFTNSDEEEIEEMADKKSVNQNIVDKDGNL